MWDQLKVWLSSPLGSVWVVSPYRSFWHIWLDYFKADALRLSITLNCRYIGLIYWLSHTYYTSYLALIVSLKLQVQENVCQFNFQKKILNLLSKLKLSFLITWKRQFLIEKTNSAKTNLNFSYLTLFFGTSGKRFWTSP